MKGASESFFFSGNSEKLGSTVVAILAEAFYVSNDRAE